MKKTLLVAAAALAVAITSSQAQVYSANIVGYVNTPVKTGYNNVATPLDANGGNTLTNLIPGIITGAYDGSSVYVWNGTGYTTYTCDSSLGGLADGGDNNNVASPIINPGTTFFFQSSAPSNTVTFAGTVHADATATGTNFVGTSTNSLHAGLNFVSSVIPVGGGLGSVLQLPVTSGALDGATVYVPNISGGSVNGFTTYTIDSSLGGFADGGDNNSVPEPVINVGTGFFINCSAFKWVQSY